MSFQIAGAIASTIACLQHGMAEQMPDHVHFGDHGDFEVFLPAIGMDAAGAGRQSSAWMTEFSALERVQVKQTHAVFFLRSEWVQAVMHQWEPPNAFRLPEPTPGKHGDPFLTGWQALLNGADRPTFRPRVWDAKWVEICVDAIEARSMSVSDPQAWIEALVSLSAFRRPFQGTAGVFIANEAQMALDWMKDWTRADALLRGEYDGNGIGKRAAGRHVILPEEKALALSILKIPQAVHSAVKQESTDIVAAAFAQMHRDFRRLWVARPIVLHSDPDGSAFRVSLLRKLLEVVGLVCGYAGFLVPEIRTAESKPDSLLE